MKSGPGRILMELILGAIALGGVVYGAHWKTQAQDRESRPEGAEGLFKKVEDLERQNQALLERIQQMEQQQLP